jgi:hypothetical protein
MRRLEREEYRGSHAGNAHAPVMAWRSHLSPHFADRLDLAL